MIMPIYSDLQKKFVLVTGATRGIGKEIAKGLAKQKACVCFNYREGKEHLASELIQELKTLGAPEAYSLCFDLRNPEQIQKSISDFTANHGPISGLVNNAGFSKDQIVLRLKESDVSEMLDVNLKGAILVTSALSRSFLKGENVSIVNISSVVGLMGNASQISYASAKAGLIGFTKSYARELASRNIRCNAICPGFIETEMTEALDEKVKQGYLGQIPLGRMGNAEEVANLSCFLLSQASAYITGTIIKIDGGLYI